MELCLDAFTICRPPIVIPFKSNFVQTLAMCGSFIHVRKYRAKVTYKYFTYTSSRSLPSARARAHSKPKRSYIHFIRSNLSNKLANK